MSLNIMGQLGLPYIKPHQKRINRLMTLKSTIVSEIATELTKERVSSLKGSYLTDIYSTPTAIKNPVISDVICIHLIDQSGLVVAEKKIHGVKSNAAIHAIVDKMVLDLPRKGWRVIIETVRDGVRIRNDTQVNATHAMEAIPAAILTLANEVYDDLPSEGYKTTIIDSIQDAIFALKDIVITLDNGNTYKLLAVAKTQRFADEFSNTAVPRQHQSETNTQ